MAGRKWTAEEDSYLKDNAHKNSSILAKKLDRTVCAVNSRRLKLGIKSRNKTKEWTKTEINYIKKHKGRKTNNQIAQDLNVPLKTLQNKVWDMNRRKKQNRINVYDWLNQNGAGMTKAEALRTLREIEKLTNDDYGDIDLKYSLWREQYLQCKVI